MPLNLVGSLRAPTLSWDTEAEALRDEIEGTVLSLLGLVGIAADPLASREFVLLANLLENAWRAGRDLDLATLIGEIQTPPLRRLGVFDVDTFFPPRDRLALAMRLNGLAASPSFAAWSAGAPLDMDALLRGAAIVYLAHLSDEERQFAVALVLSKLVTWMRGQPGTTGLRVLVYMDEVFGFVPPTATPPAKKPILTLLKQGRAFGVGMVLVDPEPRRPRLQGDGQRGHLDGRPPPDRQRQGARARGPAIRRRRDRHGRARRDDRRSREAPVHAGQRPREHAGRVHHARHPLPPDRPAHARPGGGATRAARRARAAPAAARARRCRRPPPPRRAPPPPTLAPTPRPSRRRSPRASPSATSISRRPGRRRSARSPARRCTRSSPRA